jgi:formylmethanofuran dehydrogenase subunit E
MEEEIEQEGIQCERCGEETSGEQIGDEGYNYCRGCNWVTHN